MAQSPSREGETAGKADSNIPRLPKFPNVRITLKDWRMLHAVVSCGTFASAGELLHVSQPAISYAVGKLEEQLGLPLLKLEGRKYQLTDAGQALLEHSRLLLQQAAALEEFARYLQKGWNTEIRLAVDQEFPTTIVLPVLQAFSESCKKAAVRLMEVRTDEIEKLLHEEAVDLAINRYIPSGFHGDQLLEVGYAAVAHPAHALFRLERPLTQADLDCEVEVLIKPDSVALGCKAEPVGNVRRYWQVSNLETAESALCKGIGYGWLPRYRAQRWLERDDLAELPLLHGTRYKSNFYLIQGRSILRRTEADWLAGALHNIATTATELLN